MSIQLYSFFVHATSEGPQRGAAKYEAVCADIPSVRANGKTRNLALEAAESALKAWMKTAADRGEFVPPPMPRLFGAAIHATPQALPRVACGAHPD